MSTVSVSHLYPFRRVKIDEFGQVIDPDDGLANFLTTNPDRRFTPICHECGSKAEGIHSWHRRSLHDLPLGNFPSLMFYNYRKIKCPNCDSITLGGTIKCYYCRR